MKILLAALCGFVATLGLFAGGFVTAYFLLSAEPTPVWKPGRDTAGAWTLEPVAVSGSNEELERLPARPPSTDFVARAEPMTDEVEPQPSGRAEAAPVADDGPVAPAPETAPAMSGTPTMSVAHVQWCADRYRSYRVEDNSYTPYGGGSKECVSPFLERSFAGRDEANDRAVEEASAEITGALSPQHVEYCFDRYRSYRPEDNSYQPYGGGPRRQCL